MQNEHVSKDPPLTRIKNIINLQFVTTPQKDLFSLVSWWIYMYFLFEYFIIIFLFIWKHQYTHNNFHEHKVTHISSAFGYSTFGMSSCSVTPRFTIKYLFIYLGSITFTSNTTFQSTATSTYTYQFSTQFSSLPSVALSKSSFIQRSKVFL